MEKKEKLPLEYTKFLKYCYVSSNLKISISFSLFLKKEKITEYAYYFAQAVFLISLDRARLSHGALTMLGPWGHELGAAGQDPPWGPFMLHYSFPAPDLVRTSPGGDRTPAWGLLLQSGFALKQPGTDPRLLVVGGP